MIKQQLCRLSPSGECYWAELRSFNFGLVHGKAQFCRRVKAWVADMEKCEEVKNGE
ncbi:MAG: hypothetical protein GY820_39905 [Gammaproteobacteria bacterium]|nr:hypothetical protein [Gammaproteobacteria bacterium]